MPCRIAHPNRRSPDNLGAGDVGTLRRVPAASHRVEPAELTDAVLTASRVLVGVAARSLAKVDESVTLPQFRALVVLASRGELSVGQLAEALDVHPSTATRLCDRLVARRLVRRIVRPSNRRETLIALTARGRKVVDVVTESRRADIERIIERIPMRARSQVVRALQAFADAADEPPASAAMLGWNT